MNSHSQWMVYLPILLLSVVVMVPAIVVAEKYHRMKAVFVGAVVALAASQFILFLGKDNVYVVLAAITLFFAGFNVMEASLPSLVTKTAPPEAKGTATGIYSSSQFLGIFIGGVVGGWVTERGQGQRICLVGGTRVAMAAGRGDDEAAQLSDDPADSDRGGQGLRCRGTRGRAAPSTWRGRGRSDCRGTTGVSQGRFEDLRRGDGAIARRCEVVKKTRRSRGVRQVLNSRSLRTRPRNIQGSARACLRYRALPRALWNANRQHPQGNRIFEHPRI